jgi:hypothetical protein
VRLGEQVLYSLLVPICWISSDSYMLNLLFFFCAILKELFTLSMVCIFKTTTKYKRKCLHEKAPIFFSQSKSVPRSSEGHNRNTCKTRLFKVVFYFSFSLVETAALSAPRDEIIRNCFTSKQKRQTAADIQNRLF